MIRYALVLDSGLWFATFGTREEARAYKEKHNRNAREQKQRGELVSLRYAVGIARFDTVKLAAMQREQWEQQRKPRKRRAAA